MTKTLLLHHGGNNNYRCFCRNLLKYQGDKYNANLQILHGNLFAAFNSIKPHIIFLPTSEYTQEFHDFITEYNQQAKIVLLIDREVNQEQLIKFWTDTRTKLVIDGKYAAHYDKHTQINYQNLYDSDIFNNQTLERNGKIATLLSDNNDYNHKILENLLYPANPKSTLVLFNNPAFKHPQNVGIFNAPDLNFIFNTFSYVIDLDNKFVIESVVCNIPSLDLEKITDINNPLSYMNKSISIRDTQKHSYSFFVKETLIPFLME